MEISSRSLVISPLPEGFWRSSTCFRDCAIAGISKWLSIGIDLGPTVGTILHAMLLGPFQHLIMRCWLVFIVVWFDIVFAHGVILKSIPHQDAAQIGVVLENNSVEVKDFTLLKLRTTPNRCQRRQMILFGSVFGPYAENQRPMLQFHGIKMVNSF